MHHCSSCGKEIHTDIQNYADEVLTLLGVDPKSPDPLSVMYLNLARTIRPHTCSKCGEWLCCACVLEKVRGKKNKPLEHDSCGGLFSSGEVKS